MYENKLFVIMIVIAIEYSQLQWPFHDNPLCVLLRYPPAYLLGATDIPDQVVQL